MLFTPLHRYLGRQPGPLTDEMINDAVEAGVEEADDLDWKKNLIDAKDLVNSDFPKDVAAMANRGGGVLVYGVKERQGVAFDRCDAGLADENYQRTLTRVAVSRISPPVFGLRVFPLGSGDRRAVVVVIPAGLDGPHLVFRGEMFGAPVRNGPDTEWMKEREIEAAYRARFDSRQHADTALDNLYQELAYGKTTESHAWVIAVAAPRTPATAPSAPTQDEAQAMFRAARDHGRFFAGNGVVHAFDSMDLLNPRVGLRRWTAANIAHLPQDRWKRAWGNLHHDGAVTLAAVLGGAPNGPDTYLPDTRIESNRVEATIADFMSLLLAVSQARGTSEYAVKIGIEWRTGEPLIIQTTGDFGFVFDGGSIPLARYTPVTATVTADAEPIDFHWQIHGLATDCINQGGINNVRLISPPASG
ncbi:Putative DNA-binding domain-containing protein [Glycomyces sambucus]|uniref:Putative DNA-binding domain-containing protein n=1 Tax=Glycomyces sambucus TaxID=380244 RepID=A0A1G9CHI3_9ACTN|nr:ATP-binding protein [Glycomyces sambucus]SDK51119.1 Putative DNA-binding domain-containing protein [Glycomyces sambucus]